MTERHRCCGCGHRWEGPLPGGELCGDCWRKVQPTLSVVSAEAGSPEQVGVSERIGCVSDERERIKERNEIAALQRQISRLSLALTERTKQLEARGQLIDEGFAAMERLDHDYAVLLARAETCEIARDRAREARDTLIAACRLALEADGDLRGCTRRGRIREAIRTAEQDVTPDVS